MESEQSIKRPSGRIYVCAAADRVPDAFTPCVLDEHIRLEPKALGTFLRLEIPARAEDLLVIAGAVAFVDRRVTRHHAKCWERDLYLSVPVRDFEFWSADDLQAELSTLLEMLTGDTWRLTFRRGRTPLPIDPQGTLPLAGTPPIVIPYSNGLDSFAVARLHAKPGQQVIRVSTGRIGDTEKKIDGPHAETTRWVSMPVSLPNGGRSLREKSYRSRGFLFGAVAATAAGLMQGTEIVVPESGQGTFGPALTVIGHEHPDVRMSPVFTSLLGRFISRVFEGVIRFVHPRIWSTKGETLIALREAGLSDGWEKTFSCNRGSRQSGGKTKARHCGLCANCVLRRQSLLASGLSGETYIWADVASAPPWTIGDGPAPGKSKVQQAVSAALAMRDFAMLDPGTMLAAREAKAIAVSLGEVEDVAIGGVNNVLRAHRKEWLSLVGTFPSASLFRELGALS